MGGQVHTSTYTSMQAVLLPTLGHIIQVNAPMCSSHTHLHQHIPTQTLSGCAGRSCRAQAFHAEGREFQFLVESTQ